MIAVAVRVSALIAVVALATPASAQLVKFPDTSNGTAPSSASGSTTSTPTTGAQSYIVPSGAASYITAPPTGTVSGGGSGGGSGGSASSGASSSGGGAGGRGTVTGATSVSSTAPTTVSRQPNWLTCPSGGPASETETAILGTQLSCAP